MALFALVRADALSTDALEHALIGSPTVDPNETDYDRRTVMHVAASTGRIDVIRCLAEHGADVNRKDRWGRTPADDAAIHRQRDCLELLLSLGSTQAKPGLKKQVSFGNLDDRITAYLGASARNDVEAVKSFLSSGKVHVSSSDTQKRTAMHVAASEGNLETLTALAAEGADFNMLDRWGNTPLDDARRGQHEKCIEFLESQGALESSLADPGRGSWSDLQFASLTTTPKPEEEDSAATKALLALHTRGQRELWSYKSKDIELEPEPFASGSGGEVYRCIFRSMPAVAKTYKLRAGDEVSLQELGNEINIMASIRHPNIAIFYGACFEMSPPMLIEEMCDGGTLQERILASLREHAPKHDRITSLQRTKYALEIALALTFLHQFPVPIAHCDLRPTNILLSAEDNIKLTSFGLARLLPTANAQSGCNDAPNNRVAASPKAELGGGIAKCRWSAPEVFLAQPLSTAVDAYSFSMVVYWLYSGEVPLGNITEEQEAAHLAAVDSVRPDLTIAYEVTEEVGLFLQRCWNADPKERPKLSEACDFFEAAKEALAHKSMFSTLRQSLAPSKKHGHAPAASSPPALPANSPLLQHHSSSESASGGTAPLPIVRLSPVRLRGDSESEVDRDPGGIDGQGRQGNSHHVVADALGDLASPTLTTSALKSKSTSGRKLLLERILGL